MLMLPRMVIRPISADSSQVVMVIRPISVDASQDGNQAYQC